MTTPTEARTCTCHPDDNPPVPCPQKYAYSECVAAAKPPTEAMKEKARALRELVAQCGTPGDGCDEIIFRVLESVRAEALTEARPPRTTYDHRVMIDGARDKAREFLADMPQNASDRETKLAVIINSVRAEADAAATERAAKLAERFRSSSESNFGRGQHSAAINIARAIREAGR